MYYCEKNLSDVIQFWPLITPSWVQVASKDRYSSTNASLSVRPKFKTFFVQMLYNFPFKRQLVSQTILEYNTFYIFLGFGGFLTVNATACVSIWGTQRSESVLPNSVDDRGFSFVRLNNGSLVTIIFLRKFLERRTEEEVCA